MKPAAIPSHPVLTTAEVKALEMRRLGRDEARAWSAMQRAGAAVAAGVAFDLGEAGGPSRQPRLLVLAGKGNNAGDALIAARRLLEAAAGSRADVLFAFGPRVLGPLAARAWRALQEAAPGRVHSIRPGAVGPAYDVALDGIFGFQYRPPLPPAAVAAIAAAAGARVRLRAAVDLPSGLNQPGAFHADFTYATGSVKADLLACTQAGRLRYLDLGFFGRPAGRPAGGDQVLLREILAPLGGLRPAQSDKRRQGHVVIVGGSGNFPGAVLMTTLAALRSGAGLVTACVPEHLVPVFAARAPEAMWRGLPVNAAGNLSPAGHRAVLAAAEKASALVLGPGLGKDPATHALLAALLPRLRAPLVLDADALQPDLVRLGPAPRILTPHAGEFERIALGLELRALARSLPAVVVAKAPVTRLTAGGAIYHSFFGGPILARGGSGDLLAGLAGGLLAQTPADPLLAAARAVVWHGAAADCAAHDHGATASTTTQLLDFLAPPLAEAARLT